MSEQYELTRTASPTAPNATMPPDGPPDEVDGPAQVDSDLHKRTLRKLDFLLLPFLALLCTSLLCRL
jgi:hypothetical protein